MLILERVHRWRVEEGSLDYESCRQIINEWQIHVYDTCSLRAQTTSVYSISVFASVILSLLYAYVALIRGSLKFCVSDSCRSKVLISNFLNFKVIRLYKPRSIFVRPTTNYVCMWFIKKSSNFIISSNTDQNSTLFQWQTQQLICIKVIIEDSIIP